MDMSARLDAYLNDLEHNTRATPITVKNYRSSLTRFTAWLAAHRRGISDKSVKAYLAETYPHAQSANVVLVRIKGFAKFLDHPLDVGHAREEVTEPEALTSTEVSRLVAEASKASSELGDAVAFLASTGLRWGEFSRIGDDSTHATTLNTVDGIPYLSVYGKGRKTRLVPLTDETLALFHRIQWPFKMNEKTFRHKLAQAGDAAHIRFHAHPHLLRATFISVALNEHERPAIVIAKIVGHSSVDLMLKHYFRATLATLQSAMVGFVA